ncbi:MAG: hypothetical protein QCI38_01895 [Candidatus Thermoplasmatota archaeon]|nr:hypothetical protein [Candidatus Thermoplasmatota archaeon]
MGYKIFKVPKDKSLLVAKVTNDDVVSRQSITSREGGVLGLDDAWKYVLIEGSEQALSKAKEMFAQEGVSEAEDGEEIYNKIKEEEDSAAGGMGMIFG